MRTILLYLLISFFPAAAQAAIVQQEMRPGITANADYLVGERSKPAVLVLHGFLQTRDFQTVATLVRGINDSGYTVLSPTLSLNIPNRAQSLACEAVHKHGMDEDVAEIGRWVGWLKSRGHRNIVLLGHSFGSLQLLAYLSNKPDPAVKGYIGASLIETQIGAAARPVLIALLENRARSGQRALYTHPLSFSKNFTSTPDGMLSYVYWDQARTLAAIKQSPVAIRLIMGDADTMSHRTRLDDEQHRFGVEQRAQLWKKNTKPPHVLVMTATPIPRTLAMTLYGDLDVSVIDELPPGRKPIKTIHRYDSSRLGMFKFLEEEINKGRQVYIVYPLINESEKSDYKDLMDGYESICRRYPLPQYKISIVHGQMKSDAKKYEMERFIKGDSQILVATTVIEVGVNVPNASVMVIESAERFGLSQLHQLRGRVGRGADQSFCILMSADKLSNDAVKRMEIMTSTNDGFVIAEEDMRMRGPGDLAGTQQSSRPPPSSGN